MEKIELIDTGRLTEKQTRLNMEKCAEFLARMIQKYGDVVLAQIGDSDIFYVRQPYDDGQPKWGEDLRKKCYIYTRVSTAAQTEGYSLEAQSEREKEEDGG